MGGGIVKFEKSKKLLNEIRLRNKLFYSRADQEQLNEKIFFYFDNLFYFIYIFSVISKQLQKEIWGAFWVKFGT